MKYKLDFQLSSPHIHFHNDDEPDIKTFKNNLFYILTTYTYLPVCDWDFLSPPR